MRITIIPVDDTSRTKTIIDGAWWMNRIWINGEVLGLEKQGIEGWYDSLEPRDVEPQAIPGMDGGYEPENVTLESRIITLRLVHRVNGDRSSSIGLHEMRQWCSWIVGRKVDLVVDDPLGPRMVHGFVSAQIPVTLVDSRTSKFELIVTCPDPRKYGSRITNTVSQGRVPVENNGDWDTWPSIHVDGHVTTLTVSLDDRKVTWSGDADGLDIDMVNLKPSSGVIGVDDGFSIPPGRHIINVATAGDPTGIQISYRPAWR